MKNGHIKKIAMRPLVRKVLQNNDVEKDRPLSFFSGLKHHWKRQKIFKEESYLKIFPTEYFFCVKNQLQVTDC